jgi:NDP-sugar pyrophosphorylase family protein
MKTAVILATGHPAHKSQLLQDRARAMLPALGKPLIVRVMEQFYRAGIRHYVLIVGMNEGAVASYLSKQWVPDAKIDIALQMDNDDLMTTLKRVANQLGQAFVFASYNSFTHERFALTMQRLEEEHRDKLILTGARSALASSDQHFYAVTQEHKVIQITQSAPANGESHFILLDYALCGQAFVDFLRYNTRDPKETYGQNFLQIARSYLMTPNAQAILGETAWILRVESDNNLLTLNRKLLEESADTHILSELPYSVKIVAPVRIDPQVTVGEGATIGPNVYLERGASIGYGATVANAVVLGRGVVPPNERVENVIVTSRGRIV